MQFLVIFFSLLGGCYPKLSDFSKMNIKTVCSSWRRVKWAPETVHPIKSWIKVALVSTRLVFFAIFWCVLIDMLYTWNSWIIPNTLEDYQKIRFQMKKCLKNEHLWWEMGNNWSLIGYCLLITADEALFIGASDWWPASKVHQKTNLMLSGE